MRLPIDWPSCVLRARGKAGSCRLLSQKAARHGVRVSASALSHIANGRSRPTSDAAVWLYLYAGLDSTPVSC